MEQRAKDMAIEIAKIENADFTTQRSDIFHHIARARLANGELVFLGVVALHELHETLHGEGVVLGRNGKFLFAFTALAVAALQHFITSVKLSSLGKELGPVLRQTGSMDGTAEERDFQ